MFLLSSLFAVAVSILSVLDTCTGQRIRKPRHHPHHHQTAVPLIGKEVEPENPINQSLSETPAEPVDYQKWWLLRNTGSTHESSQKYNHATANFQVLQEDWQDRMGKGIFPSFIIRKIDFHSSESSPPFNYMFPGGPGGQQDVADQGILEPFISYHFLEDIKKCCADGHGHFLDIGSSFGWYSLLSASLGCHVDTYEPVPWFRSLLNYNKDTLNVPPLNKRITVHNGEFLGNSDGNQRVMVVPTLADKHLNNVYGATEQTCAQGPVCIDVNTTTVDTMMKNPTEELQSCALKVDAEGFEPDIFAGAQDYLTNNQPSIIILRLSPGMQGRFNRSNEENIAMFDALVFRGYVPHLLTSDVMQSKNLNTARGNINAKRWKERPTTELISKCGFSCIVYLKRPW